MLLYFVFETAYLVIETIRFGIRPIKVRTEFASLTFPTFRIWDGVPMMMP